VATITAPSANWNGSETITFTATDPGELSDSDQAIFTVVAVNQPPQFSQVPRDTIVTEGQECVLTISCHDLDGDDVTFECLQCPEGAYLVDQVNQTDFVFIPDYSDVDQSYVVQIGASDGIDDIDTSFGLDVVNSLLQVIKDADTQGPTPPGDCRENLVTDTLEVWFNENVSTSSLVNRVSMISRLGEPMPIYLYQDNQDFFRVVPSDGMFTPLDRIGLIIDADVMDLNGYSMGTDDTVWAHFGPVVYPGDADNNGIVDERDILRLGVFWAETGCDRHQNPEVIWTMNAAHAWEELRATYADMDGDGDVDADDICCVSANWGKTPHDVAGRNEIEESLMPALKKLDERFVEQIYKALADCPEGGAKMSLLETFEALLDEESPSLPYSFALAQNYPNPFNPSTTIEYSVLVGCHVEIAVYDLLGKRVKSLIDEPVERGLYTTVWDGADETGTRVASGIYFYRMQAGDYDFTRKMLMLK
ncbi:MAG: T9SS type A sorting domain-containing protein, partial [candidate division Zixibacteria bacterium]|nr:T9SS type A sorting domain-containing protein [candidate division Zixibacteria bacterium]